MFGDIGWAELLVIGVVALIVIGPEDLPDMFRQLGRFTAKIRQMSREFSRAMEDAAKQSGVKDVTDDLKSLTSPKAMGLDKVREAADRFEKWDPIKSAARASAAKTLVPPPMPATPAPVVPQEPVAAPVVAGGPETQALRAKQAAKKAVLAETSAKLKAIETGDAPQAEPKPGKPRAKPATQEASETVAAKPRAPRKPKADKA